MTDVKAAAPTLSGGRRTRAAQRTGRPGQGRVAFLFLLPALISLGILRLFPAGVALVDGFFRESLLRGGRSFVGLHNYVDLISNPDFRQSVGVTLLFTLIVNPLQVAVALLLAILFTQRAAGSHWWRSLVILPIATPPAVSAVIWSVIYRPDGLANGFLEMLRLPPQPFLTSPVQALPAIIILLSWIGVGYWMLFLIAGINDIPAQVNEAASLDGAGWWRRLWHITLPLVRRPLAFVLVADTVSNLLVFAPVQILTKGGPNGSTNLMMYDIYNRAYAIGDIHTGQAEVILLVAVTLVVVAAQFRLLRGDD
ncbi:carbohydrate ABC transporter permease [Micromonospora inositola]|uniref:Carbohydrate ABC transporter membrane protein 1, CUT1 family n=1 Tax=Micromonospora inositola TaxID=47865 RepID=A0A1C5JPN1_9ACTN|nr:sugar ABC transporter permease [Micromonospora inositola]SCG72189.1 carbohydrate ABC transporter membrane protein 1, CUT1 family [Micromonospora inositola]